MIPNKFVDTQLVRALPSARNQNGHHQFVEKGGYRGRTNLYSIDLDKLPIADLSKTVVSDEARRLAIQYAQSAKMQRKPKGWNQQAAFAIEKMRKRSGGNIDLVRYICGFAIQHPAYRKLALKGPGELLKLTVWKKLVVDYNKWATAQQSKAS